MKLLKFSTDCSGFRFGLGSGGRPALTDVKKICAFGAAPRGVVGLAGGGGGAGGHAPACVPLPATLPVTWVPCCSKSAVGRTGGGNAAGGGGGAGSLALRIPTTRPAISGWSGKPKPLSIPESSTCTI